MKEKANNEVYNHPGRGTEPKESLTNKVKQKIAANPNPRANENIKDKEIYTDENDTASQAGSEITDGEDG